jgi:hypothetical protein
MRQAPPEQVVARGQSLSYVQAAWSTATQSGPTLDRRQRCPSSQSPSAAHAALHTPNMQWRPVSGRQSASLLQVALSPAPSCTSRIVPQPPADPNTKAANATRLRPARFTIGSSP